jgi:hypothetical protein
LPEASALRNSFIGGSWFGSGGPARGAFSGMRMLKSPSAVAIFSVMQKKVRS